MIWPRSHKAVHRFFLANPEQIDGSYMLRDDWDGWGTLYTDEQWSAGLDIPEEPMEVLGLWKGCMEASAGERGCVGGRAGWRRVEVEDWSGL